MFYRPIYTRAKPSKVQIEETYTYHANISGNPTIDEVGYPQGEIKIELPFDGYTYFTRQAYADVIKQFQPASGEQFARAGHLVAAGISANEFWAGVPETPTRLALPIDIPIPNDLYQLGSLVEDRRQAVLQHHYQPKWPEVYPRPRPVWLRIDLFDERTIQDIYGDSLEMGDWQRITQELSFARSLFFSFNIELALPRALANKSPILRLVQLQWPVATSYHQLELHIEPEKQQKEAQWPELPLYYIPEKGCVEWRDIPLRKGLPAGKTQPKDQQNQEGPALFHSPTMILNVHEPGELYRRNTLVCHLEIELPGALLSGLQPVYFGGLGVEEPNAPIEISTRLKTDIEINLNQRFNRKILSPHQHLQFEGVMLEEIRMADIGTFLKDLGFRVDPLKKLLEEPMRRMYALTATKSEGPDEMNIWIVARGAIAATERETVIPGGKTFKTMVESGNMELDIHAELRGDVRKLTEVMNTIHITLKERFRHVTTLE